MSNKAKQGQDYEDRLKVLVHQNILKNRQALCNECDKKGVNGFCQVNFDYLPEFQPYKYNACPLKRWKESWGISFD